MIPVISAGNKGNDDWHYISAPADAIDVLAVGAVGAAEEHAPFSSWGPTTDGRVKPDVCAMGWGTRVLNVGQDSVVAANGTSFAAPVLAGEIAAALAEDPSIGKIDKDAAVARARAAMAATVSEWHLP